VSGRRLGAASGRGAPCGEVAVLKEQVAERVLHMWVKRHARGAKAAVSIVALLWRVARRCGCGTSHVGGHRAQLPRLPV
jgi:hypothetical protein